jgi:IclR family pca regulon transcriptional regulator
MMNRKKSTKQEKPRDIVGSIIHGFNVIKAFDARHQQMTLSQIAERTDMSRAGARRYLLTMVYLGYIHQQERLFRLSPKVMELGYTYMSSMSLSTIAQPELETLREKTGETVALTILDDSFVVPIAKAETQKIMAPTITIGKRFPAIYTSTGRVLIAMKKSNKIDQIINELDLTPRTHLGPTSKDEIYKILKTVRHNKYAIVNQEIEIGIRTIAVPLCNQLGKTVAAINIFTNIATVNKQHLIRNYLPLLRTAALNIQQALID